MSDVTDPAVEVARQRFTGQLDRLRPVIRKQHIHFKLAALMGTPKHLKAAHGIDDPPANRHAMALLHMELHAAEAEHEHEHNPGEDTDR